MKINADRDPKKSVYQIIYIFLGLFVFMMGYFAYFIAFRSSEVINNSYNKRQEILSKRVVRGDILALDGTVLAKTNVDDKGKETREYPYGEVFAHVIGRTSKGKTGVEESEDIRLLTSNVNAFEMMYNDLIGVKSPGDNVVTTLDTKLQQVAYDALGNYRGAVVAMEPSTGKILAMVSRPAYDPNQVDSMWKELIADEDTEAPLLNRAAQGLYPPGSTFKVLTALEYMRENPTNYAKYSYTCDGSIDYDNMVIHCYNNKKHGTVDLLKSFEKSCNTSFASIGKSLDMNSFYNLCEDFQFNKNLPVEMQSSVSSFTLKKGESGVKEAMQTAIGQGNTMISPLHNAMITAAVANGGVMMKPYVVDHIENANGSIVKRFTAHMNSKPMSPDEASYIGKMMRYVVTDGTGTKLKNLPQKVAGKTGSADHGEGSAHAWFVGYAPYNNPQIVVSVIVENVGTGSDYAVPIAKKILEAYFNK
jgi:Cell division protein FtsI/penicillin-binding protein 2